MRKPATLQEQVRDRARHQVIQEAEHAHTGLITAAVLFADGDIDKPGYELLRDKTLADLDAATEALSQLQGVEPSVTLPPLEAVLAAAEGWGAAMRDGAIAAQREVLTALIERVMPVRVGRGKYDAHVIWTPLGEALRVSIDPPMTTAVSRVT